MYSYGVLSPFRNRSELPEQLGALVEKGVERCLLHPILDQLVRVVRESTQELDDQLVFDSLSVLVLFDCRNIRVSAMSWTCVRFMPRLCGVERVSNDERTINC